MSVYRTRVFTRTDTDESPFDPDDRDRFEESLESTLGDIQTDTECPDFDAYSFETDYYDTIDESIEGFDATVTIPDDDVPESFDTDDAAAVGQEAARRLMLTQRVE